MSGKGKSHKAYPPEFKSRCARGLLEGGDTLSRAASRNGIAPSPPSKRRSQALESTGAAFGAEAERGREAGAEGAGREAGDPNRTVGQLTAGRDYLQREVREAVGTWKG